MELVPLELVPLVVLLAQMPEAVELVQYVFFLHLFGSLQAQLVLSRVDMPWIHDMNASTKLPK